MFAPASFGLQTPFVNADFSPAGVIGHRSDDPRTSFPHSPPGAQRRAIRHKHPGRAALKPEHGEAARSGERPGNLSSQRPSGKPAKPVALRGSPVATAYSSRATPEVVLTVLAVSGSGICRKFRERFCPQCQQCQRRKNLGKAVPGQPLGWRVAALSAVSMPGWALIMDIRRSCQAVNAPAISCLC